MRFATAEEKEKKSLFKKDSRCANNFFATRKKERGSASFYNELLQAPHMQSIEIAALDLWVSALKSENGCLLPA